MHRQRAKDRDAAAEQRTGVTEDQLLRKRDDPCPVRTDVRSEPAAMADDRRLRLRAKVMVSRHALATVHVATREPADADALSDRQSLGVGTDGSDPTHNFVA